MCAQSRLIEWILKASCWHGHPALIKTLARKAPWEMAVKINDWRLMGR